MLLHDFKCYFMPLIFFYAYIVIIFIYASNMFLTLILRFFSIFWITSIWNTNNPPDAAAARSNQDIWNKTIRRWEQPGKHIQHNHSPSLLPCNITSDSITLLWLRLPSSLLSSRCLLLNCFLACLLACLFACLLACLLVPYMRLRYESYMHYIDYNSKLLAH